MGIQSAFPPIRGRDVTMNSNVLEVSHLTKSFRLHHEKTNSLKALIVARGRNRFDEFTAPG